MAKRKIKVEGDEPLPDYLKTVNTLTKSSLREIRIKFLHCMLELEKAEQAADRNKETVHVSDVTLVQLTNIMRDLNLGAKGRPH